MNSCPVLHRRGLLLSLVACLGVAGCGGDPLERQEVSGTVQFKGKPLAVGTIEFRPAEGQATGVAAVITDGKYRLDRKKGLSPGNYKVLINAPDTGGRDPAVFTDDSTPPKELIPEIYNRKTTLKATVEKGGTNVFPFDLK